MKGMALRGIVSCVPEREIINERDFPWFDSADIRKITAMVGISSRRFADDHTCTSDLCQAAGAKLLEQLQWDPKTVDGLILVTQTPDYIMPPTSCLLQERLGLPETCASVDVSLGCSAYVYGLWLANSLITAGACHRILLMAGDTPSKYVNPKDRSTALLFGDAGTATALEDASDSRMVASYIMKTDGKGAEQLIVPGGGFRNRFPDEQSQYCVFMDGAHIFDFTRFRIPPLIKELLDYSHNAANAYDLYIFHQANEYLIRFIAAQCGIEISRVPLFLKQFGNTAAASVPLTLALSKLPVTEKDLLQVMFIGFGVGLSWGAVSLNVPANCVLQNFVYHREQARS